MFIHCNPCPHSTKKHYQHSGQSLTLNLPVQTGPPSVPGAEAATAGNSTGGHVGNLVPGTAQDAAVWGGSSAAPARGSTATPSIWGKLGARSPWPGFRDPPCSSHNSLQSCSWSSTHAAFFRYEGKGGEYKLQHGVGIEPAFRLYLGLLTGHIAGSSDWLGSSLMPKQ